MKRIPLTQGKYALVDDDMFDYLSQWKWYTHKNKNVYYAEKRRSYAMHRLIMNAKKGQPVDHKNRNGLDNQKDNLRFATISQNAQNQKLQRGCSSRYKGVNWHKRDKKWQSRIKINNKTIHLGYHHNEIVAAWVYDQMAKNLFKEFARLNF